MGTERRPRWRFLPPILPTDDGIHQVEVKGFSRAFWALVWRRITAREPVGFAFSRAVAGKALWVRAAEVPTAEEERALVPIETSGPAFAAWQSHLSAKGIVLPRPDYVAVIYTPSEYPPALMSAKEEEHAA